MERVNIETKWSKDPVADGRLCEQTLAGDTEAGQEFYENYKHLAWHFGNIAARNCRSGVVDSDDLSQAAFEYMLSSARRYDADRGIPFANFASKFMLHHIYRTVDEQYVTHIPQDIQDIVYKIQQNNSIRVRSRRHIMTDDEISQEFNIQMGPPDDKYVTVGGIRQAMLLTIYMGSIDGGYNPHVDHSPGNEYVIDETNRLEPITGQVALPPEEATSKVLLAEAINNILDESLHENESQFIRLRYGLDGDEPKTLDEIAKQLGVTRERTRQIESKTMAKLRHPKRTDALKDFL